MISSKPRFILFFLAAMPLWQIHGMQYVKGIGYKLIPDAYNATLNLNAGPETLKTLDKLGEDARNSATAISGSVSEGTKHISHALTNTTNIIRETVTDATQKICSTIDNGTQSLAETAEQLRQTTEKTSGDMIKSIDSLNGTANKFIDKGVLITVDPQTTQAIRDLNATVQPLANKGIQVSIDQKTTDTLAQAVTTLKPIADNGLQIKVDDQTSKALQDLATNGVQTTFSIDPKTIISSFTALGGLTLVAVSAVLIYKELTKPEQTNLQASPEKQTWKNSVKNFLKNRYVIGTSGIISGLLLIANSNRIATACV